MRCYDSWTDSSTTHMTVKDADTRAAAPADATRHEHGAEHSGPLTEEEAEDLAKQYIDDAVETVAEMQLTASQLRVRVLPCPTQALVLVLIVVAISGREVACVQACLSWF